MGLAPQTLRAFNLIMSKLPKPDAQLFILRGRKNGMNPAAALKQGQSLYNLFCIRYATDLDFESMLFTMCFLRCIEFLDSHATVLGIPTAV